MRHSQPFVFIALAFAAMTAGAAVPLRFAADAETPRTHQASAYRGETLDIEARLLWRGAPLAVEAGAEAAMCWQTNGMGDAWWTAPASVTTGGVVTATWSPSNDVGAASYRVFLRVAGPGGASYRANMLLRLLGSPGETPNALPLPVQVLDFARVAYTNEPWSVSGLTTNDVRAIVADEGYLPLTGGTVDGNLVVNSSAGSLLLNNEFDGGSAEFGSVYIDPETGCILRIIIKDGLGNTRYVYGPNASGTIALTSDIPATNGLASAEEVAALRTDASLVYQLLMGSNVVAEVTNYNSRVNSPTLRLLQLDPDINDYITVWAETNGLTRTLNEAKAYTDGATNALDRAKADRAWSRHTSGLGADAPAGTTWISTPETVIAGGYEYSKHITSHGEVWVLTSNGMGFGGDTNSYFRVSTPDGETLFSIEKTDEQIIGVQTDGISVSDGTVTLNVGVVTYNGQAPICMAAQSVTGPWADLSEGRPPWISSVATNGVNGAWSFELESTSPAAFFYFMVKQPGATVIKNSAQTDFSGGILVEGTRFYPHKSGSTLTWTTTP